MDRAVIIGLVLALGGVVALWLFQRRGANAHAQLSRDGVQEIDVVVRNGYTPNTIVVRRGIPLRLHFNRLEDNACSEKVIFSAFHDAVRLPAFQRTPVEFIPTRPGEFMFTCSFGMYQARLVVEEPTPAEKAM